MKSLLSLLFGGNIPENRPTVPTRRRLRLEPLEERDLLAVTIAEFASIREMYPDLYLSEKMSDYNVIEITAEELSDANLRAAISEAGSTVKNDLIVARTTETQNRITLEGKNLNIYIPYKTRGDIAIVSLGEAPLTISGNHISGVINVGSGNVALGGLVLTEGKQYDGGGLRFVPIDAGTLLMTRCIVSNNQSTNGRGGGLHLDSYASNLPCRAEISYTVVSGNTSAQSGGGIYSGCSVFGLWESEVRDNTVEKFYGGGIEHSNGQFILTNTKILNNTAAYGGGGIHSNAEMSAFFCEIRDNRSNGPGAGIYQSQVETSEIVRCEITGNTSEGSIGGGIYVYDANLNFRNSTVSGNHAQSGGGIAVSRGNLDVYTSRIVDNFAQNEGGGIHFSQSTQNSLKITNSLVALNQAETGGGMYLDSGSMKLVNATIAHNTARAKGGGIAKIFGGTYLNTILAGNLAPDSPDLGEISGTGEVILITSYSLVGNSERLSVFDGANGCFIGDATNPIDAKFSDPANGDFRLQWDSFAVDTGADWFAVDSSGNRLTVDLNQDSRVQGIAVNMGAYETTVKVLAENSWIGPVGGEWMTPVNWSGGHVPNEDEIANIPAGKTVRVTVPRDSYQIPLAAGEIRCSGNLEIYGQGNPDGAVVLFQGYTDIKGSLFLANMTNLRFQAGGDISGSITNEGRNTIYVYDESVTISGMSTMNELSLYAEADLFLPDIQTVTVGGYSQFRVEQGATIYFPKLENIVSASDGALDLRILGGKIYVPSIKDVSNINATVHNSVWDISSLTKTTATNFSVSTWSSSRVIGLEKITKLIGGRIYLTGSGAESQTAPFSNLVSVEDTEISIYKLNVVFPALTTYVSKAQNFSPFNGPNTIYCENGYVSFPVLKEITVNNTANLSIYCTGYIYSGDPIVSTNISLPVLETAGPGAVILEAITGYASIDAPQYTPKTNDTVTESQNAKINVKLLDIPNVAFSQTVVAGESLIVATTIRNLSGIDTRRPLTIRYYLSDDGEIGNDVIVFEKNITQKIVSRSDWPVSDSIPLSENLKGEYRLVVELVGENEVRVISTPFSVKSPPLKISIDPQSLPEGVENGTAIAVRRVGDLDLPLELTVSVDDPTKLTVPATVVIPAGEGSVTFYGSTLLDYVKDGDKVVTITVSAEGFEDVSATITVLDVPPAKLEIETVVVTPESVYPGGTVEVAWAVRNQGDLPTRTNWISRIYLSIDGILDENDILLKTFEHDAVLEPGEILDLVKSVAIPKITQRTYRILVETVYEDESFVLASEPITVLKPALTITAEPIHVEEGIEGGVTFTVTRTGDLSEELVLTVVSNNTGELTVPGAVLIPVGENSISFTGNTIQDFFKDGDKVVRITVSAEGFDSVETSITVLDVPPAELVVSVPVVAPTTVYQNGTIDVSWTLTNSGGLSNHLPWRERVYISYDDKIGDDVPKYTEDIDGIIIDPSQSLDRQASITAPNGFAGLIWIVVETTYNGVKSSKISEPVSVEQRPSVKPTAVIDDAGRLSVKQDSTRTLSATGCVDPVGRGLIYLWDLDGSGVYQESTSDSIRFSAEHLHGSQTVRLKVRDADGNESEVAETLITIEHVSPTYDIEHQGIKNFVSGQLFHWTLTASSSSWDPIMQWVVHWGDDSDDTVFLGGPIFRIYADHLYRTSGDFEITVTTTALDGFEATGRFPCSIPEILNPLPETPDSNVAFIDNVSIWFVDFPATYEPLVVHDETMRQRQMLDLDDSQEVLGQRNDVRLLDAIWSDPDALEEIDFCLFTNRETKMDANAFPWEDGLEIQLV